MALQSLAPTAQVTPDESTRKFVSNAILLSLIDPVQGEPTVHSLDTHPHDDTNPIMRFLDSFALASSTGKGRETASAVVMEQGGPTGTILRLARNTGTPKELLARLQDILEDLTSIASEESSPEDKAWDIMSKIIELNRARIGSIIERFQSTEVRELIQAALLRLETSQCSNNKDFQDWAKNLPSLMSLGPTAKTARLIEQIKWAWQARWIFSIHLQMIAFPDKKRSPTWVENIYKLGRYFSALLGMIKLATTRPELFIPIRVELIKAPAQIGLPLDDGIDVLGSTICGATNGKIDEMKLRLRTYWQKDPDVHFRHACKECMLTLHAEMQLVCFYDRQTQLVPLLLCMGTSNKACFLCYKFLCKHDRGWSVSATHSKLYLDWMPPWFSKESARNSHSKLIWDINQCVKKAIAREFETRLRQSSTTKDLVYHTTYHSLQSSPIG